MNVDTVASLFVRDETPVAEAQTSAECAGTDFAAELAECQKTKEKPLLNTGSRPASAESAAKPLKAETGEPASEPVDDTEGTECASSDAALLWALLLPLANPAQPGQYLPGSGDTVVPESNAVAVASVGTGAASALDLTLPESGFPHAAAPVVSEQPALAKTPDATEPAVTAPQTESAGSERDGFEIPPEAAPAVEQALAEQFAPVAPKRPGTRPPSTAPKGVEVDDSARAVDVVPGRSVEAAAAANGHAQHSGHFDQPDDAHRETSVHPGESLTAEESQPRRLAEHTKTEGQLILDSRIPSLGRESHPETFADAMATEESSASTQTDAWSQMEQSSAISQLVERARLFKWENGSEIQLVLKPEALGRVNLRATLADNALVATITAESDKVRRLIEAELPTLHRLIQQDGLPAKIVVESANESNFNAAAFGQGAAQQNPAFQKPESGPMPRVPEFAGVTAALESADLVDLSDYRYASRSIHWVA